MGWGASGSLGAMERAQLTGGGSLGPGAAEAEQAHRWSGVERTPQSPHRCRPAGRPGYPARLLRARQVPELLYVHGVSISGAAVRRDRRDAAGNPLRA